jgi:hypothetical protein
METVHPAAAAAKARIGIHAESCAFLRRPGDTSQHPGKHDLVQRPDAKPISQPRQTNRIERGCLKKPRPLPVGLHLEVQPRPSRESHLCDQAQPSARQAWSTFQHEETVGRDIDPTELQIQAQAEPVRARSIGYVQVLKVLQPFWLRRPCNPATRASSLRIAFPILCSLRH